MGSSTRSNQTIGPQAVDVRFDRGKMRGHLSDGREIAVPLAKLGRLATATPAQRRNWRLIGRGVGIRWEDLNEDLSVRGLLAG